MAAELVVPLPPSLSPTRQWTLFSSARPTEPHEPLPRSWHRVLPFFEPLQSVLQASISWPWMLCAIQNISCRQPLYPDTRIERHRLRLDSVCLCEDLLP